jgi:hypothetical protein
MEVTSGFRKNPLVAAGVPSPIRVFSRHVVNVTVYNQAGNEGTMYSAPSPFDEPTKPIDVKTLRAWSMHPRHETHSTTSDAAVTPGPGAIAGLFGSTSTPAAGGLNPASDAIITVLLVTLHIRSCRIPWYRRTAFGGCRGAAGWASVTPRFVKGIVGSQRGSGNWGLLAPPGGLDICVGVCL